MDVPATLLPIYGVTRRVAPWRAQQARMSRWMFGVGVGLEIRPRPRQAKLNSGKGLTAVTAGAIFMGLPTRGEAGRWLGV